MAFLAPFWYTGYPVLYIYLSNSDGLPDIYYQKIVIETSTSYSNIFAYKIIGDFDVDNDKVNGNYINNLELGLTYPMQNKVEYYL